MDFCCWIAQGFSITALAVMLLATPGCRHKELAVYGTVPDFQLTAQNGAEFRGSSLEGSVWVADFFFTNCTGPCPRMSSRFRQIEKKFDGRGDLKLVSMTVDPARDTTAALAGYARKFGAEQGRWYFLTGPMEDLNRLSRKVFLLGGITGDLNHSTRFVLVDRHRQIRGFYQSGDPDSIRQLLDDIQFLLKEKA